MTDTTLAGWIQWALDGWAVPAVVAGFGIGGSLLYARRFYGRHWKLAKVLPGRWAGVTRELDQNGDEVRRYDVTWEFSLKWGRIRCKSISTYKKDNGQTDIDSWRLLGRIRHNQFIQLDYEIQTENELAFGSEVLKVEQDGKSFSGTFVGAAGKKGIISGDIRGEKLP